MTRAARLLPALLLLGLADMAAAQAIPEGSSVARVLAQAEAECKAADPEAPATLSIAPEAITWTDLDGDEARDDAIVDFNAIFCSLSGSMWHGTGGAPVHALPDAAEGGPGHQWTGWGWQVIQHAGTPLLLLSRHGTACDGSGADPCVMAVSFADGQAYSLTSP